jgi:hypothetical protein
MRKTFALLLLFAFALSACGPSPEEQATLTAESWTETPTSTPTFTPTFTLTPTITFTPTLTLTPTVTATPTSTLPTVTVNKQAHCRYGPSAAFLHAADLYAGDKGVARWRGVYSQWLYVQFEKLSYSCWVAPSVVDVVGDVSVLPKVEPDLQRVGSNMYGPPPNVQAYRNGDEVTITWDRVEMTKDDDRGYFIEAFVCQGGAYLWWTYSFKDQYITEYAVEDEAGCIAPSYGKLFTVEKHGYSLPVDIPWPKP